MNRDYKNKPEFKNQGPGNGSIFGILLILFGGALILNNLDLIPYRMHHIIFSWPMLLIVLGSLFAFAKNDKKTGITLMVIGGIFMLPRFLNCQFDLYHFFWPVLLIIIGVMVIRKRNFDPQSMCSKPGDSSDYINELNLFGGGERIVNSKNFKGGRITSIFGGSEVNLTYAKLAEGTNVIDVFAMFGGSVIIVPADWDVKVEILAILGGVADKRMPSPNYIIEPKKELIIRGFVALGGCEIKSQK